MSVEIFEERVTVYYAACDECDWYGESHLEKSDAERERKWHAEHCEGSREYDPRTPREKYQDSLDAAVRGDHL